VLAAVAGVAVLGASVLERALAPAFVLALLNAGWQRHWSLAGGFRSPQRLSRPLW
jgi:hypothetical protein